MPPETTSESNPVSETNPIAFEVTSDNGEGGGADITPPGASAPASPASVTIDWGNIIPEDLREKETFKNILKSENPGTELAKQLDNAQRLIGQRPTGRPSDDASEDDWNKYWETVRPKSADDYAIKPLELGPDKQDIADLITDQRTPERLSKIKALAHKHALPKREFEAFAAEYEQMQAEEFETFYRQGKDAEAKSNAHFDELSKKITGDPAKTLAMGKQFLEDFTTADERKMLESLPDSQLPNQALILLAMAAKRVNDKYEKGDSFDGPSKPTSMSVEDLKSEMAKLQALPSYTNSFATDHESVRAKVRELAMMQAKLLG